ncbi:MAG: rhomboid family intramembrane serine protease [Treponema sp.]|nr:rhomboid family intramembrane serine protease [Treponema sp.]
MIDDEDKIQNTDESSAKESTGLDFIRRPFKYVYFNATLWLILSNVLVYGLCFIFKNLEYYLSMNVGLVIYKKMFWQFVTYMFVHGNISHILFNMLALLIFGFAVEKAIGSKEFLLFYFVCGILSGFLSFVVYYFTGSFRVFLMGASGAIYSILFAYAVIFPKSKLYIWGVIPIPAPILVAIYTIIEIVGQFLSASNIAHMTHLFGFLVAWLYFVIRMKIHPIKIWRSLYSE